MDELRLIRRDDQSLIVATENGVEFRFIVDAEVLTEIRHMSRRDRDASRVSPRDIQRLIREGKTRAEVIELIGADETDIIRYEEPVLAERRFMLDSAHAVKVRTVNSENTDQQFGEVMKERLTSIGADAIEWSAWKEEESGWKIGLEFISHDIVHNAVWLFDHRKAQLTPDSPDAVTLSRQGEVGDRLIPKLRAVEHPQMKSHFAHGFDPDDLTQDITDQEADDRTSRQTTADSPVEVQAATARENFVQDHDTQPVIDTHAEFLRRREIDQRSVSTQPHQSTDLNETSDLLDALRKRRIARELLEAAPTPPADNEDAAETSDLPHHSSPGDASVTLLHPDEKERLAAVSFLGTQHSDSGSTEENLSEDVAEQESSPDSSPNETDSPAATPGETAKPKKAKGRASIPSWDDILFGTRSEEDPAN